MAGPVFDKVAVLGFGEAGPVFARACLDAGVGTVAAYDILIADPATAGAQRAKTEALGVVASGDPASAARGAQLILSTVTADQTVAAAESVVPSLGPGQSYLDLNSTSPRVKRAAADAVVATGAAFVEGVAMDTVPNFGARVPLLVSGPSAAALADVLNGMGLNLDVAGPDYGQASSAKMLRSVLIKGISALFGESMLAAEKIGLGQRVIDSLGITFPGLDWKKEIAYYLGRSALHAKRQAAEMRASAETVRDLGVDPLMTEATAARLQWAADIGLTEAYKAEDAETIAAYARAVEKALKAARKE
jgi:3-hydroxyisobutyrate dehydrogenase-like beta-hydroxyacid dehydrogenase